MQNYPYESLTRSRAEPTWLTWIIVIVATAPMAFLLVSIPGKLPALPRPIDIFGALFATPAILVLAVRGQYFYWLSSVAWLGRGYASHFLAVPKGWRTCHSLSHSCSPAVSAVLANVQYGDRPDRVRAFAWWGTTSILLAAMVFAWHVSDEWLGLVALFVCATVLIYVLRRAGLESWALMLMAINGNPSLLPKLSLLPLALVLQVVTFPVLPLSEDRFYFWKIYSNRRFPIPIDR